MAVVQADIVRIAPELVSLDAGDFAAAIADAQTEISADSWGGQYDVAVKYLAAHKLAISRPDQSGPGGRTYTYETPTEQAAGPFARTRYGLEFFRMRSQLALTPLVL
jgi:hypothetical protein